MLVLLFIIHSIEIEKSSEMALGSGQRFAAPGVYKSSPVRTYSQYPLGPEKELREITIQEMYL